MKDEISTDWKAQALKLADLLELATDQIEQLQTFEYDPLVRRHDPLGDFRRHVDHTREWAKEESDPE